MVGAVRVALAALLLVAIPLHALGKPGKKAEAKQHLDAGTAAYQAKDYDKAIQEFEASNALVPDPQLLYNIAQSNRLAHHPEQAVEYYKKYLDAAPDAPNKAAVEQRMAELQKEIDAKNAPPPPPPVAAPPPSVPAVATAPTPAAAAASTDPDEPKTPYEVGVRLRYIFVTRLMMAPFLAAATDLNSVSAGIEFSWVREKFDVVTSLDFSWLPVGDGNYLGVGHDPSLDTHYTEFKNLSFISADVSIIGHTDVTKWLQIRYGGGLGIGVVLGDVLLTNGFAGCTLANVSDIAACHPVGVDLTSPNKEQQLAATEAPGQKDTAGNPHRHPSADKPPVMGVVNLLVAARFKLPRKFSIDAEIGFRDAMFVGLNAHYHF
jgi:hypothetical protein